MSRVQSETSRGENVVLAIVPLLRRHIHRKEKKKKLEFFERKTTIRWPNDVNVEHVDGKVATGAKY